MPDFYVLIGEGKPEGHGWDWAIYSEDPAVWESTPEATGTNGKQADAYFAIGEAIRSLIDGEEGRVV